MKKKIISGIAVVFISVMLFGCGKSELVINTENAISDIGEVSIESKDKIDKAEGYYNALTDKQKEQVENASVLVDARNTYNKIEEEVAKEEAEDTPITDIENIAVQYLLNYAKGLKNPRSLKIYDVWVDTSMGAQVLVSISAENSVGGTVENTIETEVAFMLVEKGETWDEAIEAGYEYESYMGIPNYWVEMSSSSSRIAKEENRLDSNRIQKFYDENVYTIK